MTAAKKKGRVKDALRLSGNKGKKALEVPPLSAAELATAVRAVREANPSLGNKKFVKAFKDSHPELNVKPRDIKRALKQLSGDGGHVEDPSPPTSPPEESPTRRTGSSSSSDSNSSSESDSSAPGRSASAQERADEIEAMLAAGTITEAEAATMRGTESAAAVLTPARNTGGVPPATPPAAAETEADSGAAPEDVALLHKQAEFALKKFGATSDEFRAVAARLQAARQAPLPGELRDQGSYSFEMSPRDQSERDFTRIFSKCRDGEGDILLRPFGADAAEPARCESAEGATEQFRDSLLEALGEADIQREQLEIVIGNLTVGAAMDALTQHGCSPAMFQTKYVVWASRDASSEPELRVITYGFVGGPVRGPARPDMKHTPFVLKLVTQNLLSGSVQRSAVAMRYFLSRTSAQNITELINSDSLLELDAPSAADGPAAALQLPNESLTPPPAWTASSSSAELPNEEPTPPHLVPTELTGSTRASLSPAQEAGAPVESPTNEGSVKRVSPALRTSSVVSRSIDLDATISMSHDDTANASSAGDEAADISVSSAAQEAQLLGATASWLESSAEIDGTSGQAEPQLAWCKHGALANLEGKVGRVQAAPDSDGEVQLSWADGATSDWIKITRLTRPSSDEEQGYQTASARAEKEEEDVQIAAEPETVEPEPESEAAEGPDWSQASQLLGRGVGAHPFKARTNIPAINNLPRQSSAASSVASSVKLSPGQLDAAIEKQFGAGSPAFSSPALKRLYQSANVETWEDKAAMWRAEAEPTPVKAATPAATPEPAPATPQQSAEELEQMNAAAVRSSIRKAEAVARRRARLAARDDDDSSSDDEFGTSNPSTPGGTLLVTRQRFGGEKVRRTARPVGAAKQRMLSRQGAGLAHSKAMYAIASRQFAAVQSRR